MHHPPKTNSNSGLATLASTTEGMLMAQTSTNGISLNNALKALLNASDNKSILETRLPTALNDALDAMSQIMPVVEPGDSSTIANIARALHEIKINSMPGLK